MSDAPATLLANPRRDDGRGMMCWVKPNDAQLAKRPDTWHAAPLDWRSCASRVPTHSRHRRLLPGGRPRGADDRAPLPRRACARPNVLSIEAEPAASVKRAVKREGRRSDDPLPGQCAPAISRYGQPQANYLGHANGNRLAFMAPAIFNLGWRAFPYFFILSAPPTQQKSARGIMSP